MKDKFTINAMMADDMEVMMKRSGDYQLMLDGKLACPCGEAITDENLTAVKKIDGKMVYYHNILCATDDSPRPPADRG